MSLGNFMEKKIGLTEIDLQNRILELEEFIPNTKGIDQLLKKEEQISMDNLIKAIQNLVAAEKLEIIPEPDKKHNLDPKYKVNKNKKIDVSKFMKNLRKIHETRRLDKEN